jgi:hypothetical protein
MDKAENRWSWLPAMMPGVARLMAEKRATLGAAYVAECWRRGVIEREPGWFYAREGAIAIGVPFEQPDLTEEALPTYTRTQALLVLREPEATDGAH